MVERRVRIPPWVCLSLVTSCAGSPGRPPREATAADTGLLDRPAVAASCVWREVQDRDEVARLLESVAGLSWDEHTYGAPRACRLHAAVRCAPDLDGDGDDDTLVRFRWRIATDDAVALPCASLPADDPSLWEAEAVVVLPAAVVTYTVEDGQTSVDENVVDFVTLAEGRHALRGTTQRFDSADGCELEGRWVRVVETHTVRTLLDTTPAACPR